MGSWLETFSLTLPTTAGVQRTIFCICPISHTWRWHKKLQKCITLALSIPPPSTVDSCTTMTPNINNGICAGTKIKCWLTLLEAFEIEAKWWKGWSHLIAWDKMSHLCKLVYGCQREAVPQNALWQRGEKLIPNFNIVLWSKNLQNLEF